MALIQTAEAKGKPCYCEFHKNPDSTVIGRVYKRGSNGESDALIGEETFDDREAADGWARSVMADAGEA